MAPTSVRGRALRQGRHHHSSVPTQRALARDGASSVPHARRRGVCRASRQHCFRLQPAVRGGRLLSAALREKGRSAYRTTASSRHCSAPVRGRVAGAARRPAPIRRSRRSARRHAGTRTSRCAPWPAAIWLKSSGNSALVWGRDGRTACRQSSDSNSSQPTHRSSHGWFAPWSPRRLAAASRTATRHRSAATRRRSRREVAKRPLRWRGSVAA